MARINAAYECLRNDATRAEYDEQLGWRAAAEDIAAHFAAQQEPVSYHATITISFEESVRGCRRVVEAGGTKVDIWVAPGVESGDGVVQTIPGGSVRAEIQVTPSDSWRRKGNDIFGDLSIHAWEAYDGGGVDVLTPHGTTVRIEIPAGVAEGKKMRLRGLGATPDGSLVLRLRVVAPEPGNRWLSAALRVAEGHAVLKNRP